MEEVGTKESFAESLKLCRAGLMVGPSSGFALAGLFSFLSKQKASNNLDKLRNKNGKIVAVFICPDSPLPYLNEYFEYLDESNFPAIENEQLLINKPERKKGEKNATTKLCRFRDTTGKSIRSTLFIFRKRTLEFNK